MVRKRTEEEIISAKESTATAEYVEGHMAWLDKDECQSADPCPYAIGSGDRRCRWWMGYYDHKYEEFFRELGRGNVGN